MYFICYYPYSLVCILSSCTVPTSLVYFISFYMGCDKLSIHIMITRCWLLTIKALQFVRIYLL